MLTSSRRKKEEEEERAQQEALALEKQRRELLEKQQREKEFQPKLPAYWVKVSGAYCPILQLNKSEGGRVRVNVRQILRLPGTEHHCGSYQNVPKAYSCI